MDRRLGLLVALVGCGSGAPCEVSGVAYSETPAVSCAVQFDGCAGTPSFREVACGDDGICGCTPEGSRSNVDAETFCLLAEASSNGEEVDDDLVALAVDGCGW